MEEQDLILKEAFKIVLFAGVPVLFSIIIGIIFGLLFYLHDLINASMVMANSIALGSFIGFYLISFKYLNICFLSLKGR